ncbi:hypothetical protein [Streptomyces narbonensis]|uniref:hypothetical protein n=1 Tax=Streptomyces narbonensis TaxID=67333 RepID=UPI0033D73A47
MNTRRALVALLAALLTSGCVAVREGQAPSTPARPGGLAPAAERPPAALPDWPEPTQAPPRENLAVTGPGHPGRPPAKSAPAEHLPAERAPAPHQHRHSPGQAVEEAPARSAAARKNPRTTTERRTSGPVEKKPARRTVPSPKSRPSQQSAPRPAAPRPATSRPSSPGPSSPRPRQPVTGQAPEMRALCRQAREIDAPMGAADLCRGMHGR